MDNKFASLSKESIETVDLPDYWGGYKLIVDSIEFWQGRANRMHDRILYTKQQNSWQRVRLLP